MNTTAAIREYDERFGEVLGQGRGSGRPDPARADCWRKVTELREGDHVDLQGDRYADPDAEHPEYEFDYAVVDTLQWEGPGCLVVHFESTDSVGFPPTHNVRVAATQER